MYSWKGQVLYDNINGIIHYYDVQETQFYWWVTISPNDDNFATGKNQILILVYIGGLSCYIKRLPTYYQIIYEGKQPAWAQKPSLQKAMEH